MTLTIGNHSAIEDFLARLEKVESTHLWLHFKSSVMAKTHIVVQTTVQAVSKKSKKKRHKSFVSNILNLPEKSICKVKISIAEDGYLHLFDLGTSGTCKKFSPWKESIIFSMRVEILSCLLKCLMMSLK